MAGIVSVGPPVKVSSWLGLSIVNIAPVVLTGIVVDDIDPLELPLLDMLLLHEPQWSDEMPEGPRGTWKGQYWPLFYPIHWPDAALRHPIEAVPYLSDPWTPLGEVLHCELPLSTTPTLSRSDGLIRILNHISGVPCQNLQMSVSWTLVGSLELL